MISGQAIGLSQAISEQIKIGPPGLALVTEAGQTLLVVVGVYVGFAVVVTFVVFDLVDLVVLAVVVDLVVFVLTDVVTVHLGETVLVTDVQWQPFGGHFAMTVVVVGGLP